MAAGINVSVDPEAVKKLHQILVDIRDEAGEAVSRMDEDPPESDEEFQAEKARLMAVVQLSGALEIAIRPDPS